MQYTEAVEVMKKKWEENPLPEWYVKFDKKDPCTTVEGLYSQVESMRAEGENKGLLYAAYVNSNNYVSIATINVDLY